MSRLTDLIAQAKAKDPQLGADLDQEFKQLSSRLPFGLNFERHRPEAVRRARRCGVGRHRAAGEGLSVHALGGHKRAAKGKLVGRCSMSVLDPDLPVKEVAASVLTSATADIQHIGKPSFASDGLHRS